jgi:tRNA A37 threonylcarbamoyladenosine modification protein TsaB
MGAARAAVEGAGAALVEYDALRGEVYRAAYAFAADGEVRVVAAPALAAALEGPSPLPAGTVRATERDASAAALLRLVGAPGGAVAVADPSGWEPAYGRPAEAEARRHRAGGGGERA